MAYDAGLPQPDKPLQVYRRLTRRLKPHGRMFALAVVAMGIFAASSGLLVWMLQPLIDGTFVHKDPTTMRWIPIAYLGVFLVRGLSSFCSEYCMGLIGRYVIRDLRSAVFGKFMRLPVAYFEQHSSGSLTAKLTYHSEQVAESVTDAIITIVRDGLSVIAFIAVMIYYDAVLAAASLIVAPVIMLLFNLVSKRFRRMSRRIQNNMGDVTEVSEEVLTGHRVVKVFNGESYEDQRFHDVNERNRVLQTKLIATKAAHSPVIQTVAAFAIGGVLIYATRAEFSGGMEAGDFIAFFVAMTSLLGPLKRLSKTNAIIQRGIAAADDLFHFLEVEEETDSGELSLGRARGEVRFERTSFKYRGADCNALSDIDLHIQPGETVAFVGKSGSGKTTLLSLLPRFHDPVSGRVLLDGHDLREYRVQDLRRQIALVEQQVTLFNDTVANNIAYGGLLGASRADIERAAKIAHAWEFIQALPQGLDTVLGQNAITLSGGQRQRLAIARAVLKDAPLLILDEATSALDSESEKLIQEALQVLMQSRTTLVIAHRLSTIQHADRIVVMSNSRIVEIGKHDELLARNGAYAQLYEMQFGGESA